MVLLLNIKECTMDGSAHIADAHGRDAHHCRRLSPDRIFRVFPDVGTKLQVKIRHKWKVIKKQRKDLRVNISPPRIEMTLKVRANAPELPENVADLLEGKAEELAQLFVDFADELAEKHSLPGLLPAVRHQISGPRANRIGRVSASSVTRKAAKSIEGKEKS